MKVIGEEKDLRKALSNLQDKLMITEKELDTSRKQLELLKQDLGSKKQELQQNISVIDSNVRLSVKCKVVSIINHIIRLGDKMTNLLYVQTSGIDTPERLYSPFILAQTAKAMDIDAIIYFLGMGVTVLKKGNAEKIKMGAFPSLKEVMDQTIKAGVKLMVCEQSCKLINLNTGDFIPTAEIVGAATLNDLVLEADGTMWF